MEDYPIIHNDLMLNTKITETLKLSGNTSVIHILHLWDDAMTDTFEHA